MTDTIRNAIEGPRRAMGVILKKHLKTPDDICTLPREAMQWVLDHWDEAAPELLSVVDRYTSGVDRSDEAAKATSIVLHLGGEKQDTRMFPLLCRLARDREALHTALGEDNVPTTFREILISTYDGDQGALKGLIEAAEVDEFVRGGALHVVAYLSATGRIARDETEAYLRRLYETMRPQQVSYVWFAWVLSIAQLGFWELSDVVRQVFARGLIMPRSMGYDDFCRALERTLSDPERMAGFRDDQLGPFEDAIGELSDWDWFSDAAKRNEERRANSPEMRI